jgi:class 3 adenylate cyclase/predicted ATPase
MVVSRRTVTVLFADVADSTPLGERLDAESLRQVMTRYFEQVGRVLERHGGTVEKFIGDAIMAVFGIPELHEDDALRAVRAATELREALARLNEELDRDLGVRIGIRVGVNTGEVVTGNGGGDQHLVTGDAVNVTKRLEEAARTGEILMSEATRRLVENAVLVEPREELTLKGKSEPIVAWSVLAAIEGAPAYARRLDTPLVGRQFELDALREVFAQVVDDNACRLVTIVGPAGIGKSRLTAEFCSEIQHRARIVTGRCLPYGEGITFWPLVQIVGVLGSDEGVREAVAGADDAQVVADRVLGMVGPAPSTAAGGEMFWAVRRLFEELARVQPLVLVFEDIHWAEPTLFDLLEYLAGWIHDAPVLLLCLARPELVDERPTWLTAPGGIGVVLEPLSEREAAALLEEVAREWPLDADARARITAAAEGNPLYVEQMAAMLAEGAPPDAIPPSIQALLASRLDRLPADERAVLERASVAGKFFSRGAVLQLSPESERADVDARLLSLVRKDLLAARPGTEDLYRFRHALIRDAAYAGVSKELRSELHERFAKYAARTNAGRAGELDEIVGYHLEQAFRYREQLGPVDDEAERLAREAAQILSGAGRRARERGDTPAAANLFGRALRLGSHAGPDRLDLMIDLSEALRSTGALEEARHILTDAQAVAEDVGDRRAHARAMLESAFVQLHTWDGRLDTLLPVSDEAAGVFDRMGDDDGLSEALMLRAYIAFIRCQMAETEAILSRALQHARRADNRLKLQELLHIRARAALRGPAPVVQAIEICEAVRRENAGDQAHDALIRGQLALLEAMLGRFEHARTLVAEAQQTLRDLGRTLAVALVQADAGAVELLAGDAAAATRCLRPACDTMQEIGERGYLSTFAALLSQALSAERKDEEADRYTRLSEESALAEDVLSQVLWRKTRAHVICRAGDFEEGRGLAEEAVALAEETDDLNLTADALVSLGAAFEMGGESSAATSTYQRALQLYERKGNLASVALVSRAIMSGSGARSPAGGT